MSTALISCTALGRYGFEDWDEVSVSGEVGGQFGHRRPDVLRCGVVFRCRQGVTVLSSHLDNADP